VIDIYKKRILILSIILTILMIPACYSNESSKHEGISNSKITEISKIEETFSKTIQTEKKIYATTPKVGKLNLGEVDDSSLNLFPYNRFIYFTDFGRYYYVEIGGRNSANYVLCLDKGNGNTEVLTETEDSTVMYSDEKSLYLSKHSWQDNKYLRYKLEDDNLTAIDEYPFEYRKYYIENYIYYFSRNDEVITVYRMDQHNNLEAVIDLPEDAERCTIYDNKVWYDYKQGQGLSFCDLITKKTVNFDKGKIGIINNGYMYYTYYEESGKLLRFNLSDYEYEIVCETDNNQSLLAYNFYGDYILYTSGNSLYRLSDNENASLYSVQ